jgi:hypothetical protein
MTVAETGPFYFVLATANSNVSGAAENWLKPDRPPSVFGNNCEIEAIEYMMSTSAINHGEQENRGLPRCREHGLARCGSGTPSSRITGYNSVKLHQ